MDNSLRSLVEMQVRRVRRRLFFRTLLSTLLVCWSVALLVATLWFLARPLLFTGADELWRWAVPGTLLGMATLAGLVLGWTRTPNLVAAALALDERFALKERVTTLLTLPPDLSASPAGQALLHDVSHRLEKVRVGDGFPLNLSWREGVLPLGAMLLAIGACLFDPVLDGLRRAAHASAANVEQKVDSKEVQQQLDNLRKVTSENNPEGEKSKEMKELLEEWDKLVNKPVDPSNPEQVRERLADLRTLEQKMKERAHDLKASAQKNDMLKKLLEKLGENGERLKEGPAKDFEDALMKGDFHKAKEALDKLAKQLAQDQMSAEQRKQLAQQLKQVQEKMQKLMEKDEKLKQLKKDFKEGRISKEQLDREMEKFKDLQQLANLLGECKECLANADPSDAAAALEKMAKAFEQAELTEQELDEILRNMEALNEAENGIAGALDDALGNGMNGGGPPGGIRPIDPDDPNSKITPQRQNAKVKPGAEQRISGYAPGGNFTKVPAKELPGVLHTVAQNAPEAIERQNIPEDMADIARGYFQKLGGQK